MFAEYHPWPWQRLDGLSDRFIDGLCALMQRGNYRMLSQRDWQFAKSENFMFTVPVQVAWESLDSSMISRLFVRHPHVGLQAAQLARRVLVFHRGAGVLQKTSFFLEEKLEWRENKEYTMEEVKGIKHKCLEDPEKHLWIKTKNNQAVKNIFHHIRRLHYADKPDYEGIRQQLLSIYEKTQTMYP